MAFNPENTERPQPKAAEKPSIDAADLWMRSSDSNFSIKTGVATPPDSLVFTSPYAKHDDVLKAPPAEGFTIMPDVARRIALENIPKDKTLEDLIHPKDSTDTKEPLDPRQEADKRDADAMMDAIRKGKLDDLKNLVSDMSPEKLKRVAEQMKAEGFDISTTKDGKFVMFNKELGLGVSVQPGKDGEPAKAEVVKQDKDGNYVPSTDGLNPEKLLNNFRAQIPTPLDNKEIERIVREMERNHPEREPWLVREVHDKRDVHMFA